MKKQLKDQDDWIGKIQEIKKEKIQKIVNDYLYELSENEEIITIYKKTKDIQEQYYYAEYTRHYRDFTYNLKDTTVFPIIYDLVFKK